MCSVTGVCGAAVAADPHLIHSFRTTSQFVYDTNIDASFAFFPLFDAHGNTKEEKVKGVFGANHLTKA